MYTRTKRGSVRVVRAVSALVLLMLLAGCSGAPATTPTSDAASPAPTSAVAVSPTAQPTVIPTPAPPAAGRYLVVIDTAFIREGAGIAFPIAAGGVAQAPYNAVVEFDAVVKGDQVGASVWWGHLASGLGFVSMAGTQTLTMSATVPPAAQPPLGQYGVAVDGVYVREGPGRAFAAANQGSAVEAYGATLEIDAVVQGEPINGNPWWGHLAGGLGFVSMGLLGQPGGGAQPTAVPTPTPTMTSTVGGGPVGQAPTSTPTPITSTVEPPTNTPTSIMPTVEPPTNTPTSITPIVEPPTHTPTITPTVETPTDTPTPVTPTVEPTSYTNGGNLLGLPTQGAVQVKIVGQSLEPACSGRRLCLSATKLSRDMTLQITLKEFPPGQPVQLDFFREEQCPEEGTLEYCYAPVISVQTAATDSRGETIFDVPTDGARPDRYLVRVGGDRVAFQIT
jgi:hypothetical protein